MHRTWNMPHSAQRARQAMQKELAANPEHGCMLVRHSIVSPLSHNPSVLVQIWRRCAPPRLHC